MSSPEIHNLRDFTSQVLNIARQADGGIAESKVTTSSNVLRNPSNGEGHQVGLENKLDTTYKKLNEEQRIHLKRLFDNADKQLTPEDKDILKGCLATMGSPKAETPFREHMAKGFLKLIGQKQSPAPSMLREGHEKIQNIRINNDIEAFSDTIGKGIRNGSIIDAGPLKNEKGMHVSYDLDPPGGIRYAGQHLFNETANAITDHMVKSLQEAGLPRNAKVSNMEIAFQRRPGQFGENRLFFLVLVTCEDGSKFTAGANLRVFEHGGKEWEDRADEISSQPQNAQMLAFQLQEKINKGRK